jgi:DNA modification methylase
MKKKAAPSADNLPVGEVIHRDDVPISACVPHPQNYNKHGPTQIARLRYSLRRFGQVKSLVLQDRGDGAFLIVAGEGVWRAMVLERWQTLKADILPVTWSQVEVMAYLAVDNEMARLSDPDQEQLGLLLVDIHQQAGQELAALAAGTEERLAEMFASLNLDQLPGAEVGDDPGPQGGDAPERLLDIWQVEIGQLWAIPSRTVRGGWHCLRCGNSRSRYDLANLMADNLAAWVWTDPPYGADYAGRTKDALVLQGDSPEEIETLLSESFAAISPFLVKGCPIYVCHPGGPLTEIFMRCFREAGWLLHQDLVWVKDSMVLGHSDYHYRHEPILYGWTQGGEVPWYGGMEEEGEAAPDIDAGLHYAEEHGAILYGWTQGHRRSWYGGRNQTSVIVVSRPKRSIYHPTAKPPELVAAHIKNSSLPGSLGLDPFVGLGATIVAGERMGRVVFGQDIEPKYCAATLERLALMGLQPRLVQTANGEVHDA